MPSFRLSAIPLRIYLMLVLLLLVFPVLTIAGIVAYRATRRSLQEEAFATLQTAADSYRDQIGATLTHNRERTAAAVTEIELGCEASGAMNGICARETLRDFLKANGAEGAVLMDRRGRRLAVGKPAGRPALSSSPAVFQATPSGTVVSVGSTSDETGLSLAATFSAARLAAPASLRRGNLLLVGRVDGVERTIAGDAAVWPALAGHTSYVAACLDGTDSSVTLNPSGSPELYAVLRSVPGVGGACVVSYVPAAEVLAPADRLRRKMGQLAAMFAAVAIVLAYLVSFALTRPLFRLRQRIVGLKAGDYDSPVPIAGPGELREFAQAFAAMAEAIRISRQALVTSERRLRLAYTSAQLWVWEYDMRSGLIRWRNPSVMLGDTQMELKSFVHLIHPDDRHQALDAIREAARRKSYESEYRLRTPYGDYIWLASWGQVVQQRGSAGEIMIGVSREITEQKRAAELARQADRLAATSQMAASLAHEINNPLTSVMGAVHLAGVQSESPAQLKKLLAIAESETHRIAHIVRQLLGLYRPAVPTERVDVTALLHEVLSATEAGVRGKRQRVEKQIERGLVVQGYPEELRHAFTNVLVNATESAPEGGCVAVRARRGRAWDNGHGRGVRILVCDNGPGIPPDDLARVLEPFVGTKPARGTGLGLWVTRSVVLNHGGRLRVRSHRAPGSGTTVSIYLPEKA
jgi:PAS domain S-box-containing protein